MTYQHGQYSRTHSSFNFFRSAFIMNSGMDNVVFQRHCMKGWLYMNSRLILYIFNMLLANLLEIFVHTRNTFRNIVLWFRANLINRYYNLSYTEYVSFSFDRFLLSWLTSSELLMRHIEEGLKKCARFDNIFLLIVR